ncbi:MAG: hypothetical protein ABH885_05935 [Candidatus Omnitrophota bacterium]
METRDYSHLEIRMPRTWYARFYIRMFFQKLFYAIPLIPKIFRAVGERCLALASFEKVERKLRKDLSLLKAPASDPQRLGSAYGYKDEVDELDTDLKYYSQIENPNFASMPGESYMLYRHIVEKMSGLMDSDEGIRCFLNFGVAYAYVDSILAKKYPKVTFIGVDRSSFTQLFNDKFFGNIPNLKMHMGDIMEYLKNNRFDGGVFFHVRTVTLLPVDFIKKLYGAVKQAGFKYIVGMEQMGISRQIFRPYVFSEEPKPSVAYRSQMHIHNYPAILKEVGYPVQDIELLKTNHPHADYRIISFIGKRAE